MFRFIILLLLASEAVGQQFPISQTSYILYSKTAPKLDSICATLLAQDIHAVTGRHPIVTDDLNHASGNIIVIGQYRSTIIERFGQNNEALKNKWECFTLKILDHPSAKISKALLITGSDPRGTAFGVFNLSQKIGVSPWYWWADVAPKKQSKLILRQPYFVSSTPSVRYRGIFINDEDWGLQPWAAKTFEPETGDIGPRTYAKVFELLLRLKANLIWPAMHPSTKAFYSYPLNKKVAEDYHIVIGSSHAEPMLRNNVSEWDEKMMGHFNYLTNKERVYQYWESRVVETKENDVIYSIGMRGVHDSGIEGARDAKEAKPLVERIIADQRELLQRTHGRDATQIPQAFTAYKEVLDIYDNGLQVPDDVTLVWPDDNYGYIQRLSNPDERKRAGGSGVYYHASYWGRPHDYLWLGTTNPWLMTEEMTKAYRNGAQRLWVLNVGDIKPLEYNIQHFMDMAYAVSPFLDTSYTRRHLTAWFTEISDDIHGNEVAALMAGYFRLAFERRPEFMGWSQTEPTTPTKRTAYNHDSYGDEAQRRIDEYSLIESYAKYFRQEFPSDAFYQLVYYPAVTSSWMNKKYLYRDKALHYASQGRIIAHEHAAKSLAAHDSIVAETQFYNEKLAAGKWKGIMSMKPRDLPVFRLPDIKLAPTLKISSWNVLPEGYDSLAAARSAPKRLPAFVHGVEASYFVDVFLCDSIDLDWTAASAEPWIRVSVAKGRLSVGNSSVRLAVSIDGSKLPLADSSFGSIRFTSNLGTHEIQVLALRPSSSDFMSYRGIVESGGVVSMFASGYVQSVPKPAGEWVKVALSGHGANAMEYRPFRLTAADTVTFARDAASLSYWFYSLSESPAVMYVYTLPTHGLTSAYRMRYAVSVDDQPPVVVDFKTVNRSEEWKQNVLRNAAIRECKLGALKRGVHTLRVYAIDPGVILERFIIRFGDAPANYGLLPQTRKKW